MLSVGQFKQEWTGGANSTVLPIDSKHDQSLCGYKVCIVINACTRTVQYEYLSTCSSIMKCFVAQGMVVWVYE